MTIGDSITTYLPLLRAEAESVMFDTAVVTRGAAGPPVLDVNTGEMTVAAGTVVHTGRARLRMPTAVEAQVLFGEEAVTKTRFAVDFPWHVTGLAIGDEITFTASNDDDALRWTYRILSPHAKTTVVFKTFGCEVVE